ncbi:AAA domain-containing protein [Amphibiibacter pelophylacis]|uniref:AAA domain-containing protein n=1 Tax=Amphibiibacter pelophylacis TaxID=1799477 RepID=A0ACC6P588_9BURK
MQEKRQGSPQASHHQILSYWHKIEFFIPYDLQRQVLEAKDAEWSVRLFSVDQLARLSTQVLWSAPVPEGRRLSGFDVYLGVFDKAELADVTRRVVAETLSDLEAYEQDERGELEGLTCCASLRMSADGTPLLDDLSVSTVPWALGRIVHQGLDGLDFEVFQQDLESLKRNVKTFRASVGVTAPAQDRDTAPCSPADLLRLLKVLATWSGHDIASRNTSAPILVIRAKSVEDKPNPEGAAAPGKSTAAAIDSEEDDEDELVSETEISILNSFFAGDIAKAIQALGDGTASVPLQAYLTPLPQAKREDLYEPQGQRLISEQLGPKHLNRGHWPGNPSHAMSLMQQFAVNSIFKQLQGSGIFSVNGPPGTGKTTLLREVFAENIVRRARALSRCATSGAAFAGQRSVNFNGEDPCYISVLKDELVGFEMVVASSNNAAVENISRDLPKNKSLGQPAKSGEKGWRSAEGDATFSYLQPVARNLLERNSKGTYDHPKSDEDAWGLISCALGNKRNRDTFVRSISSAGPKRGDKPPKGFDPIRHQSLWHWRTKYVGITFAEAKRLFVEADSAVSQSVAQLDRFAALSRELTGLTVEAFCEVAAQELQAAHGAHAAADSLFTQHDDEWKLCKRQIELLKTEKALIEERRPGWWARLTNRQLMREHAAELSENSSKQATWIRRQYEAEPLRESTRQQVSRTITAVAKAETVLKTRKQEWANKVKQLQDLRREFPQAAHPARLTELDDEDWQIKGLWHSDAVNEKRSTLFVAALKLQEAWLAEVLQKGAGFGSNVVAICHLLDGKRLQDPKDALAIWRSLFMIVPVVSSTFASFARQFRHLGPNSIGWLFIDEAGQAVPQAAVGALLRTQRAVVVGDPLQIEPVFTVPIKLLEALAKTSSLPKDMEVSPDKTSVQVLADEANRLGARVGSGGKSLWIGSPLRVHRRCVDPMFSIANEIAYEGKMIFFAPKDPARWLPPSDSLDIGSSAWVQAPGSTSDKQVVPNQVELVHQALLALYRRTGTLPPVYIISPFKRVKTALAEQLGRREAWTSAAGHGPQAPKITELRDWCKERIGTVHTFQGKEESIVWLVLGCDQRTAGAARWASDKPNLLNVAVTRAKHRCFLIGDQDLWGGLRHFTAAHAGRMPRITPKEFIGQMTLPGHAD